MYFILTGLNSGVFSRAEAAAERGNNMMKNLQKHDEKLT